MLTGSHLQAFISLQAAWMNCSVGPLSFPLVPFFPFRRYRCAGHNAQLPFHKSQLCSQVHLSKKCAPHAIKCTELVVGSKLPAATHYTLQQRTSVVKGAQDPLRVISTSVTLRSAPVITGAFSLHTHQWKPSFETGQDWTSGSLWTDTLSQQTWLPPPPPAISDCAVKQEDQLPAHSLSWHSWHIRVSRCASPDSSHLFSIFLLRWWDVRQLFYLYSGMEEDMSSGMMLRLHRGDDVKTGTSLVYDYKPWTEKHVRPWHRHLVVGCSKGR